MNEMTLKGLLAQGNSHYGQSIAKLLIVEVQVEGNAPEVIINPRENFASKLEYYANAYNDDLSLKANPNIKIVNYHFLETLEDYFI